ncbi:hypothetical protein D3C77_457400 [compost metagenome]
MKLLRGFLQAKVLIQILMHKGNGPFDNGLMIGHWYDFYNIIDGLHVFLNQNIIHNLQQLIRVNRFKHIAGCLVLQCFFDIIKFLVAANDNHMDLRIMLVQILHQFNTVHIWHLNVCYKDVYAGAIEPIDHLTAARSSAEDMNFSFCPFLHCAKAFRYNALVIGDQQLVGHFVPSLEA